MFTNRKLLKRILYVLEEIEYNIYHKLKLTINLNNSKITTQMPISITLSTTEQVDVTVTPKGVLGEGEALQTPLGISSDNNSIASISVDSTGLIVTIKALPVVGVANITIVETDTDGVVASNTIELTVVGSDVTTLDLSVGAISTQVAS